MVYGTELYLTTRSYSDFRCLAAPLQSLEAFAGWSAPLTIGQAMVFILWAEADDAVCRCRRVYAFVRVVPEKSERPSGLYRRAGGSRRFVGHWFQRGCVRIAAVALGLCGGLFNPVPFVLTAAVGAAAWYALLVLPGPAAFGVTLHGVFLAGQILRRDLPGFFPFCLPAPGRGESTCRHSGRR